MACADRTFANLDEIDEIAGDIPPYCAAVYTLDVLWKMLEDALVRFEAAKDGYDGKFGTYKEYVVNSIQSQINKFMNTPDGPGNQLFKCFHVTGLQGREKASEEACKDRSWGYYGDGSIWFEIQDKAGFEKAAADHGINPDWIEFGDLDQTWRRCTPTAQPNNMPCTLERTYRGFPIRKKDVKLDDPKEVIEAAKENLDKLETQFIARKMDLELFIWNGSPEDPVQVLPMPVMMVMEAIDKMTEVKDVAGEMEEAKKKDLILSIIGGVLMLIPFVGQAVGQLVRGGTMIARLLIALGEIGNAGMAVYDIVEDPSSAPFAIMAWLWGSTRRPRAHDRCIGNFQGRGSSWVIRLRIWESRLRTTTLRFRIFLVRLARGSRDVEWQIGSRYSVEMLVSLNRNTYGGTFILPVCYFIFFCGRLTTTPLSSHFLHVYIVEPRVAPSILSLLAVAERIQVRLPITFPARKVYPSPPLAGLAPGIDLLFAASLRTVLPCPCGAVADCTCVFDVALVFAFHAVGLL
jgi:hypothetical protein